MSEKFRLVSDFKPAGDQPQAIDAIVEGINSGKKNQVLLGITGSGKTFTMASVIEKINKPALVISPNKVLAAQLYAELKSFFPHNAVEYFVSYYDYYQPEAYIPQTDTYIEKDSAINEHIDQLRLKATASLLSRKDTIVVASVSCIYNIGSPENFSGFCLHIKKGQQKSRKDILDQLVKIYYERNEMEFVHGKFRAKGNMIDVFPAYGDNALRIELSEDTVASIHEIQPLTGNVLGKLEEAWIYPAKHFVSTQDELDNAIVSIKKELEERLEWLKAGGKLLEAQRLEQRTLYDMEMMKAVGFCHGIENYSRHLSGRKPGERPYCLLDYFPGKAQDGKSPDDFLLFIDESHVAVPQIRGMYEGDRARKQTLVDFGFRLPSAIDNRPLNFREFEALMPRTIYLSATPGPYELEKARSKGSVIEQIIRPTGLVDPPVKLFPVKGQIQHLIGEIQKRAKKKERTLVLALTKKTAEDLSSYLIEKGLKTRYIHSDIDTLTRLEILKDLRKGAFDALIGINLLREGLDLPEVSLVAILDADNEGFLRSATTIIQIAGRAARNVGGEVILYADRVTDSMKKALGEMERRRVKQEEYNRIHHITPATVKKATRELEEFEYKAKKEGLKLLHEASTAYIAPKNLPRIMAEVEKQMKEAADNLDFELAAELRDRLFELREMKAQKSPALSPKSQSHRRWGRQKKQSKQLR